MRVMGVTATLESTLIQADINVNFAINNLDEEYKTMFMIRSNLNLLYKIIKIIV